MATLYLDRQDMDIRHEGKHWCLYADGTRQGTVPLNLVERVVVTGRAKLSSGAIGLLAERGIGLLLITGRQHRQSAMLLGRPHGDVARRVAQDQGSIAPSRCRVLMSEILVIGREHVGDLPTEGAWRLVPETLPGSWHWMERAIAETDESHLQLIPYVALMNGNDQVWGYRRVGGDLRLADRRSCGIGGHVDRDDARSSLRDTLAAALVREVSEEMEWDVAGLAVPEPAAWIYEHHSAVGRVHLGVLYVLNWTSVEASRPRKGEQLDGLGFFDLPG